jgi:hypothetical protein
MAHDVKIIKPIINKPQSEYICLMFKIGQEVICVLGHPNGAVVTGEFYMVEGIMRRWCKCPDGLLLNVGIQNPAFNPLGLVTACSMCGDVKNISGGDSYWWMDSKRFAPLVQDSVEEYLEQSNN